MDTPTATGSLFCPACGAAIAATSKFCHKCGKVLADVGGVSVEHREVGPGTAQAKTGIPKAVKILLVAAGFGVIVLVLLPLTAALVVPSILRHGDAARVTKAHADISSFMTALVAYKLDTQAFPTTEQGLRALRERPGDLRQWAGPYIQDVPKDPWNHDYVYRYPGEHGPDPEIICLGADGQPGGDGINADIVSWEKQ